MAKFGLFQGSSQAPIQTFDGDYMESNKDVVRIFEFSKDSSTRNVEVVSYKLDKNQFIKKISE